MQDSNEPLSGARTAETHVPLSGPAPETQDGQQRRPVVCVVATSTVCGMTQNKWLALTPMFAAASYEAVTLVWDDDIAKVAAARQTPVLRAILQDAAFDKLAEAKNLHALLDRPIAPVPGNAPTWGDLLAFDDFIGAAQWWQASGLNTFKPDLFVIPFPGAESSTPEDEQMLLAVSRYAKIIHAPVLALESQRLDCTLAISRMPVDCLLTKCAYPAHVLTPLAHAVFTMPPAWRHVCTGGPDPDLEDFLQKETSYRQQLHWEPGRTYIFLPFHVYYIEECARMLAALGKCAEVLSARNIEVLVGCGFAFRRNLTEKDMIFEGLKRWTQHIPKWTVVEGGNTLAWVLLSEYILLPYPSSGIVDAALRWGLPVLPAAADIAHALTRLEPVVSPLSAVAWLLDPARVAGYRAARDAGAQTASPGGEPGRTTGKGR